MNIKSLLLGSAAALMAVTGAQAADAVIVEAEPVEYVRICDAYGAGFFYIPGTETCLKFSGYVRVTYRSHHHHDGDLTALAPTHEHRVRYRGRLNIDARNETEWGTLRSQLRFQGGDSGAAYSAEDVFSDGNATFHGSGDAAVGIDRALISLAGFRLGYSDDYWTTVGGYGYFGAVNDGYTLIWSSNILRLHICCRWLYANSWCSSCCYWRFWRSCFRFWSCWST